MRALHNILDLIALILLVGVFASGFAWAPGRRLLLFGIAIIAGASVGYVVEWLGGSKDPPAQTAFFDALLFVCGLLLGVLAHFLFRLIWIRH